MTMPEVVEFIDRYARIGGAPVRTGTAVTSVSRILGNKVPSWGIKVSSPPLCARDSLLDADLNQQHSAIDNPCLFKTRISTACSWVNISAAQKAAILAQVGHFYFGVVGQYYFGVNKGVGATHP
jgi:hypothetical protein